MRRLCRKSSRPYLGRSASPAKPLSQPRSGRAAHGNVERDEAEVSRGHSSVGSGKAIEALQRRKAESTDRLSRNDLPRRPKLKAAGTAAARSRQARKPTGGASTRHAAAQPARKEGLFSSEYYRPIPALDHWLRRRVRCPDIGCRGGAGVARACADCSSWARSNGQRSRRG